MLFHHTLFIYFTLFVDCHHTTFETIDYCFWMFVTGQHNGEDAGRRISIRSCTAYCFVMTFIRQVYRVTSSINL